MTEAITPNISKKLSPESKRLLEEFTELSIRGANLVPDLYSSLHEDGLEHKEILNLIEERLDIGRRRLYQLLGPDQKRSFTKTKTKVKQIALSKPTDRNQVRLVVPEEPKIPPPPQVVREANILESEPEPPKQQPAKKQNQTFRINSKTCKGWPCDKDYTFEVEVDEDRNATRMYVI
jgi:hypothetical protein